MSELATQDDTSLRDTLESAFTAAETPAEVVEAPVVEGKPVRARDEAGKFAAKEVPEQSAEIKEDVAPPIEQAKEEPARRPPSSWKKETQAEWEKLPSHVQEDVLRREADFHKGIEQYKGHAQRAASYDAAIEPYKPMLQSMGVAPEAAIGELFKTYTLLHNGSQEERAAALGQLARSAGLELDKIQEQQVDPRVQDLIAQNRSLQYDQVQREQQRLNQQRYELNSQIEKFSEGKEYFNAVRDDMAVFLETGKAADLETAYDMAIWARPDLRSSLLEQQTKAAEERARAAMQQQRAKTASVSVRGSSPVSGTSAAPTGLREILESHFN
jgi:hypothetical protein